MSQENIQENSPPKLIDIDELDAKTLLGLEDAGPAISHDQPFRRWLYDWTLNPNIAGNFQKSLDKWVAVLIVANLFALVLEHVPALFEPNKVFFPLLRCFLSVYFCLGVRAAVLPRARRRRIPAQKIATNGLFL